MNKLYSRKYNALVNKIFYVLFLWSIHSKLIAQNITTSDRSIADAVVEDANYLATINKDSYTYYVHEKIRFNNDNKIELANLVIGYDKYTDVKFNYCKLYNKFGQEIKRIKKSDLEDIASMSEFATDSRMYFYDFSNDINQFPITVEFDYEIKSNKLVNIPSWNPVFDYNIEVKKSTYSIICKSENSIRFLEKNNAPKVSKETIKDKTQFSWSIKDFSSIKYESYSPPIEYVAPYVLIAPSIIVYNKFDNKFENWEDLGNWISKLNVGRDSLSSEIKNKLIDLSKNEQSTSGKINIVYKYLQSITRYVSIQFGIGGLQPQFAQKTIENGYGDCKALSMLMIALLKAIDIKAYYTLVKAGDNENIIKEFPSNQFNHAIVCVPLNKDTLWLECTDQNIQFNYLSDFTDDRDVFVIAEKPFITHTKTYTQQENYSKTIGQISIDEMGDAKCNLIKEAGFLASDNLFTIKNTVSSKTKEELITKLFNFKNLEIDKYNISNTDSILPKISLTTHITSKNYATVTGKRLFIPLNRLYSVFYAFDNDTIRNLPFSITTNKMYTDSIEFNIPKDFIVESKSSTYKIETSYGKYQFDLVISGNKISYTRKFFIIKGIYPANEFEKIKSFFKDVSFKDGILLVIKKTT